MELCTHVVNEAGEPEPLRDTQRAELSKLVSMHSMRCDPAGCCNWLISETCVHCQNRR